MRMSEENNEVNNGDEEGWGITILRRRGAEDLIENEIR